MSAAAVVTPLPVPLGRPGQLRSVTVLAEGPFCGCDGGPLAATVQVPVERLEPGPVGARFAIVGRRSAKRAPMSPTRHSNLRDYLDLKVPSSAEAVLDDPQFLAQHAYGTAAATLHVFETTLGRRMPWAFPESRLTLRLFDRVAFQDSGYVREQKAIRFGHRRDPRGNRHVSQAYFHDLVAHEVTHAILDGYRPHWADDLASLDQLALHEAIADLVALLSVFISPERVEQALAHDRREASGRRPSGAAGWDQGVIRNGLFQVANGLSTRGPARMYLDGASVTAWRDETEPHRRGGGFAAAVLEALVAIWLERMSKPGGRSSRFQVAASGASAGERVLRMLVRGLGYTPPVDATFEDVLRGILAADLVVVPADPRGYRKALRDAFAAEGITAVPDDDLDGMQDLHGLRYPVRLSAMGFDPEEVNRFLWENPALQHAARLDPHAPTVVQRVRPSVRITPDGFVVSEIGASFTQTTTLSSFEARKKLGIRTHGAAEYVTVRGGGLLRFDEGGRLCFAALKPVMDPERQQTKYNAALHQEGSMPTSASTFGGMHQRDK